MGTAHDARRTRNPLTDRTTGQCIYTGDDTSANGSGGCDDVDIPDNLQTDLRSAMGCYAVIQGPEIGGRYGNHVAEEMEAEINTLQCGHVAVNVKEWEYCSADTDAVANNQGEVCNADDQRGPDEMKWRTTQLQSGTVSTLGVYETVNAGTWTITTQTCPENYAAGCIP